MYRAPSGALRVRRRHRAVGLGPRRRERRTATTRADREHAAGDGQPVRRHGRPAGDAAARACVAAAASTDTTAPTATITLARRTASTDGDARMTITGTRQRRGGGVVAGRRGLDRRRRAPGTRRPARRAGPTRWIAHGSPSTTIKVARDRRQRQHRDARRRRHGQRRLPVLAVGPSTSRPPTRRLGRPERGRGRRQVQVRHRSARSPASASTRRRPTPARTSAACGPPSGTRLAQATFTRRDGLRLADGDLRRARSQVTPNTTYVASYFAPNGHYAATSELLLPRAGARPGRRRASTAPPLHALAQHRHDRQRRLRLRRLEHVPDQHATTATNYWVDVIFTPIAAARAR